MTNAAISGIENKYFWFRLEILTFITHGFVFSIFGLFLGMLIDGIFYRLNNSISKTRSRDIGLIMLQILVNVIIMYYYVRLKKFKLGLERWEFSLLALSFPSFFFNVQFHMFDKIKEH